MKERETAMEAVLENSRNNEKMLVDSVNLMQGLDKECQGKLADLETELTKTQKNAEKNNKTLHEQLIKLQKSGCNYRN